MPLGWKAGLILLGLGSLAFGAMPVPQQNALVRQYCAVCHTDAVRNGGLSLEHFDAAQAAPSLAAMMISKLTGGASLHVAQSASTDAAAAAIVSRKMKGGAMGAAGIPVPDKATIDALIDALATRGDGATHWHVGRAASVLTASVLREAPSAANAGDAAMYRLVLSCDVATGAGEMQLAWSPQPMRGTLSVAVDGKPPATYKVDGTESMGNGSGVTSGPAAVSLRTSLPETTLRVADLFPGDAIEFSFADLPAIARKSLAACFDKTAVNHGAALLPGR